MDSSKLYYKEAMDSFQVLTTEPGYVQKKSDVYRQLELTKGLMLFGEDQVRLANVRCFNPFVLLIFYHEIELYFALCLYLIAVRGGHRNISPHNRGREKHPRHCYIRHTFSI